MSQRVLAQALDMDPAYLSRIESDTANHLPGVETIQRIIKALSLDRSDADQMFVLAKKLPPDVESKLISRPLLLDKVRKLR